MAEVPLYGTILIGVAGAIFLICCLAFACMNRRAKKKLKERQNVESVNYRQSISVTTKKQNVQPKKDEQKYGKILLSIFYDTPTGNLQVKIIRCVNLPVGDTFTSDPFIELYLAPERQPRFETTKKKSTLNPEYDESFTFPVAYDQLSKRTAVFRVYDYDQLTQSDKLAELRLPLIGMDLGRPDERWYDLERPDDAMRSADVGQVCISLRFIPVSGLLKVTILEANGMPKGITKFGRVQIKLSLYESSKKLAKVKTRSKRENAELYFNEVFTFNIAPSQLQDVKLIVSMTEYNFMGPSKTLGRVELGSKVPGSGSLHWTNAMIKQRHPIAQWHTFRQKEE